MVMALEDEDRPQPWSTRKKPLATNTRETITSVKASAAKEKEQDTIFSSVSVASASGRKRATAKAVDSRKGKQKAKPMCKSTLDVVRGRSQNPIPDVEELRKKNEEDARACGRTVRTVSNPRTHKLSEVTTTTAGKEKEKEAVTPVMATEFPSPLPKTSTNPGSAGMTSNSADPHRRCKIYLASTQSFASKSFSSHLCMN